jgi:protein O-GlcNAc transferase
MSKPNVQQSAPLAREDGVHLVSLFNTGRYADLEKRARELSQQHPDSGFVWKVLGTALLVQGKNADGIPALQMAVSLVPEDAEAHSNLGNMYRAVQRLEDAVGSYQQAIKAKPDYAVAHFNLGITMGELGRLEEAVSSYRQALAWQPGLADAHNNLGTALKDLGRLQEAVSSYEQALRIEPRQPAALVNLGNVLTGLGRYDAALSSYRKALAIQPDMADAHNNLGTALKDLGRLDEALASYRKALTIKPDYTQALGNLLFTGNYLPDQSATELLAQARQYGDLVASLALPYTQWPNLRDGNKKLRVGLVSGDLYAHPVGYFVHSVLAALKRLAGERIELFVYASCVRHDALSEGIKACCHAWCQVESMPDEALASRIRGDGIDILMDLSGHTDRNRLPMFAWKPAPVQVSWLGYFATTGVAAIDYVIADPWTVPQAGEGDFTERIWRLPETRLCFSPPEFDVAVSALPALQKGHITFACFNNLSKMNDRVVALWAKVLQSVDGSALLLKAAQLDDAAVRKTVKARFAAQGVRSQRLQLEGPSSRQAYLEAYRRADIALDPFPFTGGTTTVESLWMGVPVLTLSGDRLVSRQGLGLLMNAGMPNWVAADETDYVAKAVAYAADLPALAAQRVALRQRMLASPVLDADRFAQHFEAALRGMWRKWCEGQA